jgi:hypothetical protein
LDDKARADEKYVGCGCGGAMDVGPGRVDESRWRWMTFR